MPNNIKYTSKDFSTIKSDLIEYTKSYFPDTYKDFNETSPGMMLIELSSYVGDVLSYYVDWRENWLTFYVGFSSSCIMFSYKQLL